ncbi:hypothetical protein APHCRT_1009 [Anaplasma phagocytophilum str. CRT53-1]|uniref:Uncharacterized protein n=1 Tax=Anaplasma phagocytophilum str. CRT53-1 TaxID=1359157 RepID=A0A0F3PZ45_ANAPH|nr:hypothetical protein APHCRT_1016 [Anaplasma phagocytophilum str. CRT53-1]KJV85645.1 hypothetical protein APHCRT_1009 [Anaplasma phagocytophilum str. CRT53-1]
MFVALAKTALPYGQATMFYTAIGLTKKQLNSQHMRCNIVIGVLIRYYCLIYVRASLLSDFPDRIL